VASRVPAVYDLKIKSRYMFTTSVFVPKLRSPRLIRALLRATSASASIQAQHTSGRLYSPSFIILLLFRRYITSEIQTELLNDVRSSDVSWCDDQYAGTCNDVIASYKNSLWDRAQYSGSLSIYYCYLLKLLRVAIVSLARSVYSKHSV
jgi:hypothetical protein